MKISVALSQRLGADTLDYARNAISVGLDGVFVFDHLIPVGDPSGPAVEAAAALGHLAVGLRGRIGALVLRATMRPPAVTAAIASTLNAIADEVVIGLGAGDRLTREETRRLGLALPPLAERITLLAETVELVSATGVATWVGGRHRAVLEVAATADGWNAWEASPEELVVGVRLLSRPGFTISWGGRVAVGPERDDVWLSGPAARVADRLAELAEAGVDEVVLAPLPPTEVGALRALAEVLPLVG